jgi:hypothetical protein
MLTMCVLILYTTYMDRIYAFDLNDNQMFPVAQKFPNFATLVNVVVKNAFVIAGVIAFAILVFGGLSVIMGAGGGDSKQMEKGRQAITGAVVGLVVIVVSVWIIQIIEKITGLSLLSPNL